MSINNLFVFLFRRVVKLIDSDFLKRKEKRVNLSHQSLSRANNDENTRRNEADASHFLFLLLIINLQQVAHLVTLPSKFCLSVCRLLARISGRREE